MSGYNISTLCGFLLVIVRFYVGESVNHEFYVKKNKGYVGIPITRPEKAFNHLLQSYGIKAPINNVDEDDLDDYDDPRETGSKWAIWCKLPPRNGFCMNNIKRYYFDVKEKWCKPFIYGGCFGNKNNFKSFSACRKHCRRGIELNQFHRPLFCYDPMKAGNCNAYIERYYFNEKTNKCEQFVYGGCAGNENRFRSLKKCQEVCKVSK